MLCRLRSDIVVFIPRLKHQYCNTLNEIIEELEQMESSSENPNKSEILTGWFPVSERLPEKEGKYLVTTFGGGMYDVDTSHFFIWEDGETEWGEYGVEAWMPLPQPYKAESEGEE
jgi:hypothetical protein